MNEKIRELAKQCWSNPIHMIGDFDQEKFAELIIQECIKRIEGTSAPLIENMNSAQNYGYAQWWEGYDERGADSIECIKKHFGIEE